MKRLFNKFLIIPLLIFILTLFSMPALLFAGNADDFAEALYENNNINDFIEGNLSGTDTDRSGAIIGDSDYIWGQFGLIPVTRPFYYIGLSTGDIYENADPSGYNSHALTSNNEIPDFTTLTFGTFEVPAGVNEFYFDYYYITSESPSWDGYDDPFTAKVYGSSMVPDGTSIVNGVVAGEISANDSFDSEEIRRHINNTGMLGGYGTLWNTASCPVSPGDIVYIEFSITDSIDGMMDSIVLLDNFRFSEPIFTIEGLAEEVVGLDLPDGIETELTAILDAVSIQLEKGNGKAAENQLNAFINKVEAQRGKKISDGQADMLIGIAQSLIEDIEK